MYANIRPVDFGKVKPGDQLRIKTKINGKKITPEMKIGGLHILRGEMKFLGTVVTIESISIEADGSEYTSYITVEENSFVWPPEIFEYP
jgi:hypothetical protein